MVQYSRRNSAVKKTYALLYILLVQKVSFILLSPSYIVYQISVVSFILVHMHSESYASPSKLLYQILDLMYSTNYFSLLHLERHAFNLSLFHFFSAWTDWEMMFSIHGRLATLMEYLSPQFNHR